MSGITTCSRELVRQGGVHERAAEVHPEAAALEYPLDEVSDVLRSEDRRSRLRPAAPRHEHPLDSLIQISFRPSQVSALDARQSGGKTPLNSACP